MRRVRRTERRGLRGLRAANRRTGCGIYRAPATPALELAASASPPLIAADLLASTDTGGGAQVRSNESTGSGGLLAARDSGGTLATPAAAPAHAPASADGGVRLAPFFIGLLGLVLLAALATWSLMRRRGATVSQAAVASPSLPPPPSPDPPAPQPEPEPESAPEPPEPQDIAAAAEQDQIRPRGGGPAWWEESEQASKPTGGYARRSGGLLGSRATSVILGLVERLRRRR
jgi:hypothetical protein